MSKQLDIDAIEQVAMASTDGDLKWGRETFASHEEANAKLAETLGRAESLELHSVFRDDPDMSVFAAYTGNGPTSAANARFFAGARRVVLALIARVRELEAMTTLRPCVMSFARAMEAKLKENEHKGGWHDDLPDELMARLHEETEELENAIHPARNRDPRRVLREAADVANFAMMIADVCGGLPGGES